MLKQIIASTIGTLLALTILMLLHDLSGMLQPAQMNKPIVRTI